jgi:hypothetical protein
MKNEIENKLSSKPSLQVRPEQGNSYLNESFLSF